MWHILIASLASATILTAQSTGELQIGARMIVTQRDGSCESRWHPCRFFPRAPGSLVIGTLERVAGDTLVIRHGTAGMLVLGKEPGQAIYISRGRSRIRSALRVALSNGLLTYAIADLTDATSRSTVRWSGGMAASGFVLGALLPSERWRRVRWP